MEKKDIYYSVIKKIGNSMFVHVPADLIRKGRLHLGQQILFASDEMQTHMIPLEKEDRLIMAEWAKKTLQQRQMAHRQERNELLNEACSDR